MDLDPRLQNLIEKELFGTRPAPRARFYLHGSRNEDESIKNGYPCYDDRVMVEIRIPDCTDFVSQIANAAHFREYPQPYEAFKKWNEWKAHSLELLPGATPATIATLHALGFFTIEQLAKHTPDTAPWLNNDEEKTYPKLKGKLPPRVQIIKDKADELVKFWANPPKPQLKVVKKAASPKLKKTA